MPAFLLTFRCGKVRGFRKNPDIGGLMADKIYDVVIVGAGTAGLSAAIYALRAGKSVLVLEEKMYGGQIVVTPEIENYPGIAKISGFEFAQSLYQQAKNLGMEYQTGRVLKLQKKENCNRGDLEAAEFTGEHSCRPLFQVSAEKGDQQETYQAQSVILATGAKNRPLGLEDEQKMVGHGISYCATCDGMFFRGKSVAVAGGGNTALEDALFLAQYCEKVYLIHRREEFRGEPDKLKNLEQKENVEILRSCVVTHTEKDEDGNLKQLYIWNKQQEKEQKISVAGLFVAVGQMPDNQEFADLAALDEKGYIHAGEDCKTGTEGLFVAGDCRTKTVRQLTTAAADGAVAALAACEYLG